MHTVLAKISFYFIKKKKSMQNLLKKHNFAYFLFYPPPICYLQITISNPF